jgi:hypothetical protein
MVSPTSETSLSRIPLASSEHATKKSSSINSSSLITYASEDDMKCTGQQALPEPRTYTDIIGSAPRIIEQPNTVSFPRCVTLTDELANLTMKAIDSDRLPEVVFRAMQTKKRQDMYQGLVEAEMTAAMITLAHIIARPYTSQVAYFVATSLGHVLMPSHFRNAVRSDNVRNTAHNYLAKNLGRDFCDKLDTLPYDSEGLSSARTMLHKIDEKFNQHCADPYYNTEILVRKELEKGGDYFEIEKTEYRRAKELLRSLESRSSYTSGRKEPQIRRRSGFQST